MSEAAVVPPVTPPVAAVVPPVTPAPAANWYDGASADDIGWITNKQFKTPVDVINSARNAEKLLGIPADRVLKLAEKMRDDKNALTPEARQIFERLGMPKEAKDYNIEVPKDYGDPQQAELFRKLFHEEGISKAAGERLVKEWNQYQAAIRKTQTDAAEAAAKNAEAGLKKDWGNAYEQNINIAKEAARTLGMDQKQVDALHNTLGQEGAMKFFHKLGVSVGEGKFIQGGAPNALLAPSQAQYEIKQLSADKDFAARLGKGDVEARAKWTRLHEQAFPGESQMRA